MFSKRIAAIAFGLCAAVLSVSAALGDETTVKLNEVVVTATKTEQDPKDVTQSVTVITADDIKKSGASTVAEAVERTAGVEVNDYGPKGSLSDISIRGSSYQQVLVLLDGRRLNSASAGGFNMSDLPVPLEDIDRIEIVRGPSSALYGADAMGGVVNIITKKPAALSTAVTGAAGSHGYESLVIGNSNRLDKAYYALSAGKEKYDGFRANSDLDQSTVNAKAGYEISPDSSLELTSDYIEKEIGVPGSLQFPSPLARQWDRNSGTSLAYRTKFTKDMEFKLNAYQNREELIYKDPDPFFPQDSRHTGTTNGAEAQTNWLANSWNLMTIGVDAREDHIESSDAGEHTASLAGVYFQDEISIGEPLIVVLGGRYDSHSVYGDKFSPRASARYLVAGAGTIIRASAGEAFRAPTLNDLYWAFDGFEQGNPDLKPESSTEYEGGVEQPFGKGNSVKFTAFERKVKDLIQWESGPAPTYIYSPVNIGKARITGYEAETKFTLLEQFIWALNYTYLNPRDEDTGSYIPNVPAEQLKSYVNLTLPTKTNLYVEGRYVRNYVQTASTNPSQHYTVADAKISQPVPLGRNVTGEIFAGIKNMFNRQYEVVAGYPMPPAEVYGGMSLKF